LLRGLPGNFDKPIIENSGLEIQNHLHSNELNAAILQSAVVICRSGYTTIMDLAILQQKAILVPTPGQTEQEYLGAYLQQRQIFLSFPQNKFSVNKALNSCASFSFVPVHLTREKYKLVIHDFVEQLRHHQ
jgi:UDP-N-acetylglucosamine:LPS N-acetylglucosamine transferase